MNLILCFVLFTTTLLPSLKGQDYTIQDPLPSCKGLTISSPNFKQFGFAVDGGGDINDDGVPDMIVSEYQNPSTVYVVYGQNTGYPTNIDISTMDSTQGFRIAGLSLKCDDNRNFISSSGDIDGDSISDIVIGAGDADSAKGAIYVIYGKSGGYPDFDVSSLPSDKGFKITSPGGRAGWNVNTKVDINGDKIKDIIIGANGAGPSGNGAVYVVYGQAARDGNVNLATMPLTRGFQILGASGAVAGAAIASAGDFNQDYVDDVLITAPLEAGPGKSYVFYGKNGTFPASTLTTSPQVFTFNAQSPNFRSALVASDAGDFKNDGVSDILISTWRVALSVYVFYGKKGGPPDVSTSSLTPSQGFRVGGVGDQFGMSLASIDDINGDGITDLLIGANTYSGNKGAMFVIYGRTDQPASINAATMGSNFGFKILGSVAGSLFGSSVRTLGDINQDGVPNIIFGAPGSAKAYVLFGPNAWGCDICGTSSTCAICKTGYNYKYNGLCFKQCPVYGPYKFGSECFKKCPTIAPYNSGYQCYSGCPRTAPYNSGFECFLACPADAPYKSDFECFNHLRAKRNSEG